LRRKPLNVGRVQKVRPLFTGNRASAHRIFESVNVLENIKKNSSIESTHEQPEKYQRLTICAIGPHMKRRVAVQADTPPMYKRIFSGSNPIRARTIIVTIVVPHTIEGNIE
jgi:hypothetical protein